MERKTFKPGELVLTQYYANGNKDHKKWKLQIYSHYDEELKCHLLVSDTMGYGDDSVIIPYKGNEDKLGTLVD